MSRTPENPGTEACVPKAAEALDRMTAATDEAAIQVLNAARREALSDARRTSRHGWLWATATAAVLALAVALTLVDRNGQELPLAEEMVADAELYQDMEFYLWLSEELESQ